MPITVTRQSLGLKMYYQDDHEVAAIYFYRDGVVVLKTRSGWIEKTGPGRSDMPGLTLNHPIPRKMKINLLRGGHFYVTDGKGTFNKKSRAHVYIDLALDDCALTDPRDVVLYELDTGITYQPVRSLTAIFGTDGWQTIDIADGPSRTEPTAYGMAVAKIHEHLTAMGLDRVVSGIEAITKDRPLLDLLLAAHDLAPAKTSKAA